MRLSLTEKQDANARIKSLRNQKLFSDKKLNPIKNELVISLNLTSAGRVRKNWSIFDFLLDSISEREHKYHWGMLLGTQKFEFKINGKKLEELHAECETRLQTKNNTTWLDVFYLWMLDKYFDRNSKLSKWANEKLTTLYQISPEIKKIKGM